ETCRRIYGNTLFSRTADAGDFIRANANSGDTIAVLGSEPEIYFYARRHSATGFIYMYPLMESHVYAGKMQDDMIREIEAANPEFVVFVTVRESWLPQPGSKPRIQSWWANYWTAHYDLARSLNIEARKPGSEEEHKLDEPGDVMVFKRKPPPPR